MLYDKDMDEYSEGTLLKTRTNLVAYNYMTSQHVFIPSKETIMVIKSAKICGTDRLAFIHKEQCYYLEDFDWALNFEPLCTT